MSPLPFDGESELYKRTYKNNVIYIYKYVIFITLKIIVIYIIYKYFKIDCTNHHEEGLALFFHTILCVVFNEI